MILACHCYRCGQNKSSLQFMKGKNRADGFYRFCKECRMQMENEGLDLSFKSGLQYRKKKQD